MVSKQGRALSLSAAAAELALELARGSKAEFIEEFVKIESPDTEEVIIPFKLWEEQKRLIRALDQNRLNIVLKARQLGITWVALSWILTECLSKPTGVIMFSRTEVEAKELVRRLGVELSHMPGICAPVRDKEAAAPVRYEKTALGVRLYLPGGMTSTVEAFASAASAARSFTANILFFDEWAFQLRAREIWASAFPTINRPTGGKVIGISTIDRGTLYEELVLGSPENGFRLSFLPWYSDPARDQKWYIDTKRALGDLITQEYPASVEEAMTVPGGCFFPEVREETHIRPSCPRPQSSIYYISLDYGLDKLSVKWVWISHGGKCRVFREYDCPDLIISRAAVEINRYISIDGPPEAVIAPPDLWSREQLTGRSRADIFREYGVDMVKASNDREDGCMALKQLLSLGEDGEPGLTIDEGCQRVYSDLRKIQKDRSNVNVYATAPHDLTHSVDALRYFAVYWRSEPRRPGTEKTALQLYKERLQRKGWIKRKWR